MSNQGFRQIFSWCETPPGSTKEVECACVPIHNASKLQGLPIDPDLDTTCVQGDILTWDGTEWVCGDTPTGPTGPCCTGPTGSTGPGLTGPIAVPFNNTALLTNFVNNSEQFGKFVFIRVRFDAPAGGIPINTRTNLLTLVNISQRPFGTGGVALSIYDNSNAALYPGTVKQTLIDGVGVIVIQLGTAWAAGQGNIHISGAYTVP